MIRKKLTSINGLTALTTVGGDLYIEYNHRLTSLDGLSGLNTVGGDLYIGHNPALCQSYINAFAADRKSVV